MYVDQSELNVCHYVTMSAFSHNRINLSVVFISNYLKISDNHA